MKQLYLLNVQIYGYAKDRDFLYLYEYIFVEH